MITSVSLQYAKALFDLAKEKNKVNEYYEYLKVANEVLKKDNVLETILHPLVKLDERKNIINNTFNEYFDKTFISFLNVLIDNNRLIEIEDIENSYKQYLNELNKIIEGIVYTKYEISNDELKSLETKLTNKFSKKVNLTVVLDEKIIGGIAININGKIIDGTMLNQLNDLKNELKKGW